MIPLSDEVPPLLTVESGLKILKAAMFFDTINNRLQIVFPYYNRDDLNKSDMIQFPRCVGYIPIEYLEKDLHLTQIQCFCQSGEIPVDMICQQPNRIKLGINAGAAVDV